MTATSWHILFVTASSRIEAQAGRQSQSRRWYGVGRVTAATAAFAPADSVAAGSRHSRQAQKAHASA
jgi:hypothetical protein